MDEQRQDDQLEPMYNCSVPIQDLAYKIFRERWTIETGGERGSGRSMVVARYDIYIYIYIYIYRGALGINGGARGVIVIVVGNGDGDSCSNPRRDWLHFT